MFWTIGFMPIFSIALIFYRSPIIWANLTGLYVHNSTLVLALGLEGPSLQCPALGLENILFLANTPVYQVCEAPSLQTSGYGSDYDRRRRTVS